MRLVEINKKFVVYLLQTLYCNANHYLSNYARKLALLILV